MENLYAVKTKNHKCIILNLVYNEAINSYSIYNIPKNNVEIRRDFKTKEEFEKYLQESLNFGLITEYYEISI